MKLLSRIIIVAAIGCGVVWLWAAVSLLRKNKEDTAFYQQHVAPALERQDQLLKSAEKTSSDKIVISPLPALESWPTKEIEESLNRSEIRFHYKRTKFHAGLGLYFCFMVWIGCGMFERLRERKQWEDANRPAHPQAGKWINEWMPSGKAFVAADKKARRVEIDPMRKVVALHNCNRITPISDGKVEQLIVLPFADILVVSFGAKRGGPAITLRTVQGSFLIPHKVEPLDALANLLTDIVELNRTQPEQYKAARAVEPILRTPWYGWAILAAIVAAFSILIWALF